MVCSPLVLTQSVVPGGALPLCAASRMHGPRHHRRQRRSQITGCVEAGAEAALTPRPSPFVGSRADAVRDPEPRRGQRPDDVRHVPSDIHRAAAGAAVPGSAGRRDALCTRAGPAAAAQLPHPQGLPHGALRRLRTHACMSTHRRCSRGGTSLFGQVRDGSWQGHKWTIRSLPRTRVFYQAPQPRWRRLASTKPGMKLGTQLGTTKHTRTTREPNAGGADAARIPQPCAEPRGAPLRAEPPAEPGARPQPDADEGARQLRPQRSGGAMPASACDTRRDAVPRHGVRRGAQCGRRHHLRPRRFQRRPLTHCTCAGGAREGVAGMPVRRWG